MNIQSLVIQACKLGAMGFRVMGWIPPSSATEDPNGRLMYVKAEPPKSPSESWWYEK